MQMTMRWFGTGHDSVTLEQIRQVPGVHGVITTLFDKLPGELWKKDEVLALKKTVEDAGLSIAGIESVNISDAIKTASAERDQHIENYIRSLEALGEAGIHMVCYNFMPVFDWTRTDLARRRTDGSTTLAYNQAIIDKIDPNDMSSVIKEQSKGYVLAGWEPERLAKLKQLFAMYKDIDEEKLFANLKYFLEAIMPTCDKYNINMAIHPDDPAWSVFGLTRIMNNKDLLLKLMKLVDNPHNGVTLCTGSLGTNPQNNIPDIIKSIGGERIHFAHLRNVRHNAPGDFEESAHLSSDGSLDMYAIVKALYDTGFNGVIRPDHGRAIWGEVAIPGYGLYDRAIGSAYLLGLWEAVEKANPRS
jgi:mannonate dehydratase